MEVNYYYQVCIKKELEERLQKNPRYSLRSFARALGIDPGDLSRLLNGSKVLTPDLSTKILQHLHLSSQEIQQFLLSMAQAYDQKGVKRKKKVIQEILKKPKEIVTHKDLSIEAFKVISDWQHYALLQLIGSEDFIDDTKWMAKQLELSEMEVKLALERLFALDLIKNESGKLTRTYAVVNTGDRTTTSSSHKKRIKQVTEKSIYALENCPIEMRNHTAITMSIDPDQIPLAKKMIEEFMDQLESVLQTKKKKVYELQINLFPLQRI